MAANGAAQPARYPEPGRRVPPRRPAADSNKPTPLDTLFIVFVSAFLLLLLLWIAGQLAGRDLFTELPGWMKSAVNGIWSKVLLGAGSAGALALRKWMYGSRPSPNYLLWIPAFMIFFAVALFLLKQVVRVAPVPPTTHYHLPIQFSAKPLEADLKTLDNKEVSFWLRAPEKADGPIYIPLAKPEDAGLYSYAIDVPSAGMFEAEVVHRAVQSALVPSALHDYEYLLCVKDNPNKPFPADFSPESSGTLLRLSCSKDTKSSDGKCTSTDGGKGYLMSCDDPLAASVALDTGLLPLAYADTPPAHGRDEGWVVPSLQTLDKMTDRERVGYTRFTVKFDATGAAVTAEHYYYSLRVNDKPIYVDGFSPDKFTYPLQKGTANWIGFGLENLNFTGQYEGYEKLELEIVFLDNSGTVASRQPLQRDYIALRDAPEVIKSSPLGTFTWTGAYVPPKNENKYEILLASANCGTPVERECIDRTMNAKTQFDKSGLKYDDKSVVMVVRPPLRIPPSYGLALGLIQPTSQVQFTFSAEEAAQVCSWAGEQIGKSKGGNLIQPNLRRYEVATRGYSPC